jgi:uncharacterized protein YqgC (DUF456 family)
MDLRKRGLEIRAATTLAIDKSECWSPVGEAWQMMIYVYAILLTLLNLAFWASILVSVPGTWLMLLVSVLVEWWHPGTFLYSWTVLLVAGGLAVLGEVLEFALGAVWSRQAGGSPRGAVLAILGSIVGGILGTALPVPIVGTLIGACLGAFTGSVVGDLWTGQPLVRSISAGRGAAVGRFWGTMSKLTVGAVMVVILGLAAFL